ncbi:TolC family protein [Fulvimarina sp. 2208YS6-2-32]|uniref:TolC family protein n=1 Tax=Fulvimarina uroteuthidis TaxID=3098149 RepID=A0ABU5I284_9HYPH|nr:TolC family protein [Fulvimarina sp. 2208YS6-2-32]MDY8109210.1 TolC family protein [Fulvimarina sp. 2208YS6-2-32]
MTKARRTLLSACVAIATLLLAPVHARSEETQGAKTIDRLTVSSLARYKAVPPARDAGSSSYALRGALDLVLERDPRIGEAAAEARAAETDVFAQLMRYTPVITASIESRMDVATGRDVLFRNDAIPDSYGKVELRFPVFTGGRRSADLKRSRELSLARQYRYQAVRDDVSLQAVELWTNAWLGIAEQGIVEERIARLRSLRASIDDRRRNGFASGSDLARLDAEIAATRRIFNDVVARRDKARAELARLGGGGAATARGALPQLSRHLPASKAQLLALARRANPSLLAAAADYRASIHQARSSYGQLLPQVDATAEWRHDLERADHLSRRDGWTVGLSLKVPLFDLSSGAASRADRERTDAALYREAQTLNTVQIDIDRLYIDKATLRENDRALEAELAARRKSAAAARSRYAEGFGDLEEVIDAQNELDDTRRLAVLAKGEAFMVDARLLVRGGLFRTTMLGG